jgi:cbb3-type cytochrome oxidase subunit 1
VLYYIADTVAGLMQGMFWLTTLPLQDSIEAALPFWAARAISGVLIIAGSVCFIISLMRKGNAGVEVTNAS